MGSAEKGVCFAEANLPINKRGNGRSGAVVKMRWGSRHTRFLNYKNEYWKALFLHSGRLLNIWIKDVGKLSLFAVLSALFSPSSI